MKKLFTLALLCGFAIPTLSGCMPSASTVTVTPVLIKVSEAAAPGQSVVLQGRYLGGPASGTVRLGADENGKGGFVLPVASVVSWTDSRIEFKLPSGAAAGGGWVYVEVAGRQSTGLPFSIKAG